MLAIEWNIPTISSALSDQHCGEASKPSTNSDKTAAKIEAAPTLKPKENSNLTFFYKNLWNESISPAFTITTFHLNYASQWLFELQMYELFMICNVTGVFLSHVLKASEKLARDLVGKGRVASGDPGRQAALQNPAPLGWKNGRVPCTVRRSTLTSLSPLSPGSPACNSCYPLAPPTF